MTTLLNLSDAAALFADPPATVPASKRAPSKNVRVRLQRAAKRGMVAPILVRDETGDRVVDGATFPAHLRRFYGVTNLDRTMRVRPHRNAQGIRGGQRGNGALHDGRVHGLTPTGKV